MDMTPTVSAIMPAFNAEAHIAEAIESIIAQTYSRWELIVVDDGSSDRTFETAARFAERDPRIRVFRMSHGGRGVARNECLKHVRGDFVAMCDADDISLEDRFRQQIQLLAARPDVGVVSCSNVTCIYGTPRRTLRVSGPRTDAQIRKQLARGRMALLNASAMLRTRLFDGTAGFDPELRRAQDYGFYLRIFRNTRFATIDDSLILYRVSGIIEPYAKILENDLFVRYATYRAAGGGGTFAEFKAHVSTRLFATCVVPLKFGKYVARRSALRVLQS